MTKHNIADDGTWRYSGAHAHYPVNIGDVWEFNTNAGDHLFVCGDLQAATPLVDVLQTAYPTLLYVDPPYNSALARGYRTKAGVDGGQGRTVDINDLWEVSMWPAVQNGLLAYLETGQRQQEDLQNLVYELGGEVTGRWDITYYGDKPAVLIAADFRNHPLADHPDFTGMDDEQTPIAALMHREPGTVVDTCAGRGLTSRSAFMAGWGSISHELSPYRLAEAIQKFHKLTGEHPVKHER